MIPSEQVKKGVAFISIVGQSQANNENKSKKGVISNMEQEKTRFVR